MNQREPIAIVGVSGLFPQSINVEKFWSNIVRGRDLMTEIPRTHWLVEDFYDPNPKASERTYCKKAGVIPPLPFDFLEFGIPPNVMSQTDSAQFLGLIAAKALFEDAFGDRFQSIDREKVSMILGYSMGTSLVMEASGTQHRPIWERAMRESGLTPEQIKKICEKRMKYSHVWNENTFPGLLPNVIAGRIANRFDLHGTNCSIDAACASSMAAVHLATKELYLHDADLVIAGGGQTCSNPLMFLCFSKTPAISPNGLCRPFDANGDGTMLGEGIGLLALRRLEDAERDGDAIYAVIRGVGQSSDGKGKSVYAPEAKGQVRALQRAYAQTDFGPDSVELVEAHGTGTKAGDAAEILALTTVFQESGRSDTKWCALGSIKSQIGHTAGGAGAASLIKATLALHHKTLPPTINVSRPTSTVDWKSSPFYINTEARPWVHSADYPRRASVSSFGFGGSNFHIALEEYRGKGLRPRRKDQFETELFLFGGTGSQGLQKACEHSLGLLEQGYSLYGIAKDTQEKFEVKNEQRLAIVAASKRELTEKIKLVLAHLASSIEPLWFPPRGIYYRPQFKAERIAFLFPGQGSQRVNMGAELTMAFDCVREVWDHADQLLLDGKTRLSEVVFPRPVFSEADREALNDRITSTQWAQPCLGVTSAAFLALLEELGLRADCAAGHSFGEEAALYFAGAYDLETFLKIARKRGELMAAASRNPGGMLAVAASAKDLQGILDSLETSLIIANFNSPNQQILSGDLKETERVRKLLEGQGLKVTSLQVHTAFHSSMVSSSVGEFQKFLEGVSIKAPRLPVYSNETAGNYPSQPAAIRRSMATHLAQPVRFQEEVERMAADGVNLFIEVGAGSTLSRLVDECLPGNNHLAVSLDQKKREGMTSLWHALGQMSAIGVPLQMDFLMNRSLPEIDDPPRKPSTVMITSATYQKKYPVLSEEVKVIPESPEVTKKEEVESQPQEKPVEEPVVLSRAVGFEGSLNSNNPAPVVMPAAPNLVTPVAEGSTKGATDSVADSVKPVTFSPTSAEPASPSASSPGEGQGNGRSPEPKPATTPQASTPPASATIDMAQVTQLLLEVVSEKTGYPKEMLELGMDMESDLGIDSIKRVEILSAIQERDPNLPEVDADQLATLQTLQQVLDYLSTSGGTTAKPPEMQGKEIEQERPAPRPASAHPEAAPASSPSVASGISMEKLISLLLEVVSEKTGYPKEMLELGMDMESDLGIDSIKRVEILSAIQERDPNLPEVDADQLATLQTLQQIVDHLSSVATTSSQPKAPGSIPPAASSVVEKPASVPPETTVTPSAPHPTPRADTIPPPKVLSPHGSNQSPAPSPVVPSHFPETLSRQVLRLMPLNQTGQVSLAGGYEILIVADERGIAPVMKNLLEAQGVSVRVVSSAEQFSGAGPVGALIYLGGLNTPNNFNEGVRLNKEAFQWTQRFAGSVQEAASRGGGWFITVQDTGGDFGLGLRDEKRALCGGLAGLAKTVKQEWPQVLVKAIDMNTTGQTVEAIAQALVQEILQGGEVVEVALNGTGQRRAVELAAAETVVSRSDILNENSVVVVSGGARGVTAACIIEMARRFHPKIVLFGRTPVTVEESEQIRHARTEAELKQTLFAQAQHEGRKLSPAELEGACRRILHVREVKATLEALRDAGSPVKYYAVDILESRLMRTEGPAWIWSAGSLVRAALEEVRREWGPITGLIHGAGVISDKRIEEKTQSQFDLVFDTKVKGLNELLSALYNDPLKLLCLFSSVAARFGNPGQCDYAMANEVMNKIAQAEKQRRGEPCVVKSINWSFWDGGMVSPALREEVKRRGIPLIPLQEGARAFCLEIQDTDPQQVEVVIAGREAGKKKS